MLSVTTIIPISLPKAMAREINIAAKSENMTRSEYVRGILRRQIALSKMSSFRGEFSIRAKKAGFKSLKDSVAVVRQLRKQKNEGGF